MEILKSRAVAKHLAFGQQRPRRWYRRHWSSRNWRDNTLHTTSASGLTNGDRVIHIGSVHAPCCTRSMPLLAHNSKSGPHWMESGHWQRTMSNWRVAQHGSRE